MALANAYAIYHEQKLNEVLSVQINEEGILLPNNARRKQLKWTETERVLIRHGNITIDTTDNFLYQWVVQKSNEDAAEIEAYCSAKIKINVDKRDSNDW